jgi:hypothetical protein
MFYRTIRMISNGLKPMCALVCLLLSPSLLSPLCCSLLSALSSLLSPLCSLLSARSSLLSPLSASDTMFEEKWG